MDHANTMAVIAVSLKISEFSDMLTEHEGMNAECVAYANPQLQGKRCS